jgi:hypothetical protein
MEGDPLKVAHFTVHATAEQSRRWKMAATAEGHVSAGSWLAAAADAYLKVRARAGHPLPLSWRRGPVRVLLDAGEATLKGFVSPPFGAFRGSSDGPDQYSDHYTLTHLPTLRIIATLRSYKQCKALASELAPVLLRGELPDPAAVVERHARDAK